MIKVGPTTILRLMGLIQGLLKRATETPLPETTDSYITTQEVDGKTFHVVVLKAAFTKLEDAENFLDLDKKLDDAIGDL